MQLDCEEMEWKIWYHDPFQKIVLWRQHRLHEVKHILVHFLLGNINRAQYALDVAIKEYKTEDSEREWL